MGKFGSTLAKEFKKILPVSLFFLFMFHMIALTKAVSLSNYDLSALRAVSATIAALLVAKAVLIVDALPLSRFYSERRITQILWKTFLYGIVILIFKFLEELIHLVSKLGSFTLAVNTMFDEISWPVFIVIALWIAGGLILYCIVTEIIREVGQDRVKEMFFSTGECDAGE